MNIDNKINSKHLIFKILTLFTFGNLLFASCAESTTPPDPKPSSDLIEENTHMESDSVPLISSFNFDPYPTYDSIKPYLKTGDILLFEKFDTAGFLIEALEEFETLPKFTHVGIVFKLPAKGNFPEGLYFWQAVPPPTVEPMNYGPDYFKGAISDGAQMVSLDSIMAQLSNQKGMGLGQMFVWVRQLTEQLSSEERLAMENYARQVDGRSFSYPVELAMPYDYYEGAIKGIQTADNSFFCSKLASQTFKEAGLIALSKPTNAILPGHFALPSGLKENPIQFYNNRLDSIINFKPE